MIRPSYSLAIHFSTSFTKYYKLFSTFYVLFDLSFFSFLFLVHIMNHSVTTPTYVH